MSEQGGNAELGALCLPLRLLVKISTYLLLHDNEKPRSNSGRTGITPRYRVSCRLLAVRGHHAHQRK